MSDKPKFPFSGEGKCAKCERKPYYRVGAEPRCGYHASKAERAELKKNPDQKAIRCQEIKNHVDRCTEVANDNKTNGRTGEVTCTKMKMFGVVDLVPGVVNIFPNFKHEPRTDGIGLPSLSPKSIGPIHHRQPGLPDSKNLENFHQGNKVFPHEVGEDGEPTAEFFAMQLEMYNSEVPYRHKPNLIGVKINVPRFSIWVTPDGVRHKLSYLQSRQFYCNYYERATSENPDFLRLKTMIADGYNLRLVGYDAYPTTRDSAETNYNDISRPFGHEMVLYTMLTTEDPTTYPWRRHKTFEF